MKVYVLCLVDHTHPATAELLDDAVVRDGLADHWRESYAGKMGKSTKRRKLTYLERLLAQNSDFTQDRIVSVNTGISRDGTYFFRPEPQFDTTTN